MLVGLLQVMIGAAWVTISWTVCVALEWLVVSVGVKVTERVLFPTGRMAPAAGV